MAWCKTAVSLLLKHQRYQSCAKPSILDVLRNVQETILKNTNVINFGPWWRCFGLHWPWSIFFIQCTPDILRSCISRNWIYRGRMLDPIFDTQERNIFWEIAVTPWTQFAGDNFSRNLFTMIAFAPGSLETILREINSSLLVNAGRNTCCAMVRKAQRIIDTSIVSQSRVRLI